MIFKPTLLAGVHVIDIEAMTDARGFFARGWCKNEFDAHGITSRLAQANISQNTKKGTLRGLHYQRAPHEEAKLVRCTRGAIFDVAVDLRPDSQTYRRWFGVELTDRNHRMLLVPEGFGHGFQTLVDDTEVFYQVSQFYTPGAEHGARYDDPLFGIEWPLPVDVISDKDAGWPPYVR